MKTLLLSMILCVFACLCSPLCAQKIGPKTACEVENAQFRALIVAADTLRSRAERRITSLVNQLAILDKARVDEGHLTAYDEERRAEQMQQLGDCHADIDEANRVFVLARDKLPRRYQKLAAVSPAALLTCYDDYIDRLQRRSWRMGGVGFITGIIGTLYFLR